MTRTHVHFAPGLGMPGGDHPGSDSVAAPTPPDADDPKVEPVPAEGYEAPRPMSDSAPVISGLRASASVLVWVAVRASAEAAAEAAEGGKDDGRGLKWWRSANGVLLTEGDAQGRVGLGWVVCAESRDQTGRRVRMWDGPALSKLCQAEGVQS